MPPEVCTPGNTVSYGLFRTNQTLLRPPPNASCTRSRSRFLALLVVARGQRVCTLSCPSVSLPTPVTDELHYVRSAMGAELGWWLRVHCQSGQQLRPLLVCKDREYHTAVRHFFTPNAVLDHCCKGLAWGEDDIYLQSPAPYAEKGNTTSPTAMFCLGEWVYQGNIALLFCTIILSLGLVAVLSQNEREKNKHNDVKLRHRPALSQEWVQHAQTSALRRTKDHESQQRFSCRIQVKSPHEPELYQARERPTTEKIMGTQHDFFTAHSLSKHTIHQQILDPAMISNGPSQYHLLGHIKPIGNGTFRNPYGPKAIKSASRRAH